ncbi:MAG: imidazole glycerol phosphate synthase subunit HisH [Nitrospina sp.]|nr:imidazole glycerol phosphate synthase subunit HisH [Nitrospina sp.]
MLVLIIDYGMGNLGSVRRSFEECGADVQILKDPQEFNGASRVVLPGVGAFKEGMERLENRGWVNFIDMVIEEKLPLLGICLGMQLLAEQGYEGGQVPGLGVIGGEVVRMDPQSDEERIPHVGWDDVCVTQSTSLFSDIPNESDFYFVHSYHFVPVCEDCIIATTPYCGGVVSAVQKNNVFGVQFHPEKSSKSGRKLLENFLKV